MSECLLNDINETFKFAHVKLNEIYWKYVVYVACNIHKAKSLCWFFS